MRYTRQNLVPQLQHAQTTLADARVLIVGAGGLGCLVAAQLAGAGVGNLVIVDADVVQLSNLHRQLLYRENDLGKAKAQIAARECLAINSSLHITAISEKLLPHNVSTLCNAMDLVIDAADNFATSYLLSDQCLSQQTPLLTASVNQTFGYVGVFCATGNTPLPSLRAAFPKLPAQQQNCDSVGVTAPSVGVIASIQAQEALKVLIDDASQLAAQLLYVDCWNHAQHIIDLTDATEPSSAQIQFIGESDLHTTDTLLDVRSADEITAAPLHITTPLQITTQLNAHPSARIVCVCKTGQRALAKAQTLISQGQQQVAVLLLDQNQQNGLNG